MLGILFEQKITLNFMLLKRLERGWLERRESVDCYEKSDGIVVHRDDNDSVRLLVAIWGTTGRRSRFKKSRFTS